MTGKCGTYAGWNRHSKAKEQPCGACREANRKYQRDYRVRTGRTPTPGLTEMERWHLTGKSGDFL